MCTLVLYGWGSVAGVLLFSQSIRAHNPPEAESKGATLAGNLPNRLAFGASALLGNFPTDRSQGETELFGLAALIPPDFVLQMEYLAPVFHYTTKNSVNQYPPKGQTRNCRGCRNGFSRGSCCRPPGVRQGSASAFSGCRALRPRP
jgi:hypothetical protein